QNPRRAWPNEHVIRKDFAPQVLHFPRLREESMTSDVEVVTLVGHSFGDAADVLWIALKDDNGNIRFRQQIRGSQSSRSGPDDGNLPLNQRFSFPPKDRHAEPRGRLRQGLG